MGAWVLLGIKAVARDPLLHADGGVRKYLTFGTSANPATIPENSRMTGDEPPQAMRYSASVAVACQ